MVTDLELISKLQQLRQIKPRENWVVFSKNNIFSQEATKSKPNYGEIFSNILRIVFQKKLAYAYALPIILIAVGGLWVVTEDGFNYNNFNISKNPSISAVSENTIKDNLKDFKLKTQSFVQANQSNPQDVLVATKEVKDATNNLINIVKTNPEAAKAIALDVNNNKTYLDVAGSNDLKEASNDLYKAIDSQMIEDLKNTTLTDDQKKSFDFIVDLYNQGKYSSALENILLFNISRESK